MIARRQHPQKLADNNDDGATEQQSAPLFDSDVNDDSIEGTNHNSNSNSNSSSISRSRHRYPLVMVALSVLMVGVSCYVLVLVNSITLWALSSPSTTTYTTSTITTGSENGVQTARSEDDGSGSSGSGSGSGSNSTTVSLPSSPPAPAITTPTTTTTSSSTTTTTTTTTHTPFPTSSPPTTTPNTGPVLELPPEFRICRLTDPEPILGQPPIDYPNSPSILFQNVNMTFRYQCAGPPYDRYMQQYQYPFVMKHHRTVNPNWGQRPTILPPPISSSSSSSSQNNNNNDNNNNNNDNNNNNNNNRHIVIIGNSHTRQMISAMLCQYGDDIIVEETRDLVPNVKEAHAMQYKLKQRHHHHNNDNDDDNDDYSILTLSVMTNHPLVYSKRWYENLKFVLGLQDDDDNSSLHNFNTIDVLIVATFHKYLTRHNNTILWQNARSYAQQYPEQEIDFVKHPNGPTLGDFAQEVYNNNNTGSSSSLTSSSLSSLIFVSMLSSTDDFSYRRARNQAAELKKTQNRTNIRAINGRIHLNMMDDETLGRHECGSDQTRKVGTCLTDMSSIAYRNAHRCMGNKGGQPDLLVWDLIEVLWEMNG